MPSYSRPSSGGFKSGGFKSSPKPSAPKSSTPKVKTVKPKPKPKPKTTEKTKTKATTQQKDKAKTETKTKAVTGTHKPVPVTPTHVTNNHYSNGSSALDWIPFIFLADMVLDDDDTETVVIEDGKVVNQSPQQESMGGLDIISVLLSVTILVAIAVTAWKVFSKKKKKFFKTKW